MASILIWLVGWLGFMAYKPLQIIQRQIHFDRNKSKVKLATVVEGDQKASFSIATTLRCIGGRYSFTRIAPLYPWYVRYIAEY